MRQFQELLKDLKARMALSERELRGKAGWSLGDSWHGPVVY